MLKTTKILEMLLCTSNNSIEIQLFAAVTGAQKHDLNSNKNKFYRIKKGKATTLFLDCISWERKILSIIIEILNVKLLMCLLERSTVIIKHWNKRTNIDV